MNHTDQIWARLIALARRAQEPAPVLEPPHGFATRVAARAMAMRGERMGGVAWDWLAVRGLGIACLVTILAVAFAWPLAQDNGQSDLADLADLLVVADASR